MEDSLTPYVVVLFLSTAIAGTVAWYALVSADRNYRSSAFALGVLMALTAVSSLLQALRLLFEQGTLFLYGVSNVVTFAVPVVWLVFVLLFTGYERLVTRRTVAALSVVPFVAFATMMTNRWHGWFFEELVVGVNVERTPGWMYDVHLVYIYGLLLLGMVVLLYFAYTSHRLYRHQVVAILVAVAVPLGANVGYQLGVGPEMVNLTSVAFSVSGVALAFAVFRYRFLDVVPVARDSVVENMRDGIVVLDREERVVDVNGTAERLLDADSTCLVGLSVEHVRLGDRPLSSVVRDEWGPDELTVEGEDGPRYVTVRPTRLSPESNGTVILLQDVTASRRTEKRYQRLIENSSDVVTVLDQQGTIRYQSPSIERVLGYDHSDMVGKPAFDYVHPDDRPALVEQFAHDGDRPGTEIRMEFRMRHADGSWRIIDAAGRNLTEDAIVDGIVVNSRDVTERRSREQELQRTNERLDEFASVVSHDLRNPLNVADGYLEEVARHVDDSTLEIVREQHDRMRVIIEDALAMAHEGEMVEETTTVSLEEAARIAWTNVETVTATLTVETEMVIEADRDRLLRAIENLFRNAIEHGGEGVTVTVGCIDGQRGGDDAPGGDGDAPGGDGDVPTTEDGSPGGEVGPPTARDGVSVARTHRPRGFYVADDGPGIPPDQLARVFESGYSSSEENTGLGLSIVAQIAAAHGWRVEAVPAADGARFEFIIDPESRQLVPVDVQLDRSADGAGTL